MIRVRYNRSRSAATRKNLDELKQQIIRRAMKDALLKAATPGVRAARAKAPKESGALKKSIGKRGVTYLHSQSAFVKAGPRNGFSLQHAGQTRRPEKYSHLVEFGHLARDGSTVAPQPFMRPAFEETKEEMKKIYAANIADGVERHAARLNRRLNKHRGRKGGRR